MVITVICNRRKVHGVIKKLQIVVVILQAEAMRRSLLERFTIVFEWPVG